MENTIKKNARARSLMNQTIHSLKIDSDWEFLFTRAIEFRQETIYFAIVDRFNDGNRDNNCGSKPELYDPTRQQWGKYWGGDLQGIIDKSL